MYRKELETKLANPNFPNYFLLFGGDDYQIEFYAKEILNKFDQDNVLNLYFDEYDFAIAKDHLEQPSLFADCNILHIKSDKKIPSKELKVFIDLCKKNSNNIFIFELYEGDAKSIFDNQKAFGENFVRFFPPSNPSEAVNLLQIYADKLNLNITKAALFTLYSIENESMILCAAELNKLSKISQDIDENLVKKTVFSLHGISFDAFFDKIIESKNIKDDYFGYLNDLNFSEILFINSLYKAFFRLFKINTYAKINSKFDLKEAIGYAPPPNIATKLKTQALSFNTNIFLEIFKLLNEAEFELKTKTNLEKESYLLSSLLNLQDLITKNRKN